VEPYSPHWFSQQFRFCEQIHRVLLEDAHYRAISYKDALYYWKRLLLFGGMFQSILPSRKLMLPQYVSLEYKHCWSKVTVNDLQTNVSLLAKSTEVNFSRCEKDEEIGSSSKILGEERQSSYG